MKRCLILILSLSCFHFSDGQSKRVVYYAEVSDALNHPFFRRETHIVDLLLDGAEKGTIPLYFFDSFKKSPKPYSWKLFQDRLTKMDRTRFQPYNENKEYKLGAEISQGASRLRSRIDHNVSLPEDYYSAAPSSDSYSSSWKLLHPQHEIIGFDYLVDEAGKFHFSYLHFYSDDFQYEASIKGDQAVKLLNATGYVWYQNENHFMDHLIADLFLFDYSDSQKFIDLWPFLDTAKLQLSKSFIKSSSSQLGLQTNFSKGHVTGFLLSNDDPEGDYTLSFLDTIFVSEIRSRFEKDSPDFKLLGDALLYPKLFKFSGNHKPVELNTIEPVSEYTIQRAIDTISYKTRERFRLLGQTEDPRKFEKNVNRLLNFIYTAISEKDLPLYARDDNKKAFTSEELVTNWRIGVGVSGLEYKLQDWGDSVKYFENEEVLYQGEVYVALIDNPAKIPSQNTEHWQIKTANEEIYQPDDIHQFEFTYRTTFLKSGEIIKKEPLSIGLSGWSGSMKQLGYLNFQELKSLLVVRNPGLWKEVVSWMENQNGIYQTIEIDPLTVYKK